MGWRRAFRGRDAEREEVAQQADRSAGRVEHASVAERGLREIAPDSQRYVYFPSHVGACNTCKRLLEKRTFSLAEAEAMRRATAERGLSGWCAECEHGYCRHVPRPVSGGGDPVAEEMTYEGRMAAVGLTDKALDAVFLSSGQADPRHAQDLEAAMAWVEGDDPTPPDRRWSWS